MNLKITKEQFQRLRQYTTSEYIFGSKMYKTDTSNSDTDILLIIDDIFESSNYYPNIHCFQFDDIENNKQWMIATKNTFNKNLLSGESNIFGEIVLFSDVKEFPDKLLSCRSYKIIKGFIGRAKFDLKLLGTSKDKKNNKSFHISRCLYVAECLLEGKLPVLEDIGCYSNISKDELQTKEIQLRTKCNSMFESDELSMYPILKFDGVITELESMLVESNNTKEFRY
jgi:hypothetical protein